MDFPAREAELVATPPELIEALGVAPVEVLTNSRDYLALIKSAAVLRTLAPDMAAIARIERSGVIVTVSIQLRRDSTWHR
jgi:predicted PhzF superfamily epimerase YddE/YHI9